jgi:hypothetical protein
LILFPSLRAFRAALIPQNKNKNTLSGGCESSLSCACQQTQKCHVTPKQLLIKEALNLIGGSGE